MGSWRLACFDLFLEGEREGVVVDHEAQLRGEIEKGGHFDGDGGGIDSIDRERR